MSSNKETRYLVARELRATGNGKDKKIEGYACTWNTQTDIGPFFEVIAPKPFRSLDTDSVVCLFNHDESLPLGRSGVNLDLSQDEIGLRFVCTLNDSSIATDCYANLKSGILSECSFAFSVNPGGETWSTLPGGKQLRVLKDLRLWDTSVVTSPAYPGTTAAARNVVPAEVEARMVGAALANGRAARNAKVLALLDADAQHKSTRAQAELAALDEQVKARLEFLKVL
jgi:HK97 family phage prohead protease